MRITLKRTYGFGSFVEAALHTRKAAFDENLTRVNRTIPVMFANNGIIEGRKESFINKLKALIP